MEARYSKAPAPGKDSGNAAFDLPKRNKPKRNSEARKQQNRESSRIYRQKRKQKLELLSDLLSNPQDSTVTPDQLNQPACSAPPSAPLSSTTTVLSLTLPLGTVSFSDLLLDSGWQPPEQEPIPGVLTSGFGLETPDLPPPSQTTNPFNAALFEPTTGQELGSSHLSNPSFPTIPKPVFTPITSMFSPFTQLPGPFAMSHNLEPLPSQVSEDTEEVVRAPEPGLKTTTVPEPVEQALESFSRLTPAQQQRLLGTLRKQSYKSRHMESVNASEQFLYNLKHLSKATSPNPIVQSIQLRQSTFLAAIFENARAIGMSRQHMLLENESLSHFNTVPCGNSFTIELVQAKFVSIPKDLRPTSSQIAVQHHPYLDVIPFASFREKALVALACDPPLFDENDMCDDMCKDALICWGSQGGGGRGGPGMTAGVAWDVRSWEPTPWFLKKYWFLVGGWDDEMWTAARWWHAMRNEPLHVGAV